MYPSLLSNTASWTPVGGSPLSQTLTSKPYFGASESPTHSQIKLVGPCVGGSPIDKGAIKVNTPLGKSGAAAGATIRVETGLTAVWVGVGVEVEGVGVWVAAAIAVGGRRVGVEVGTAVDVWVGSGVGVKVEGGAGVGVGVGGTGVPVGVDVSAGGTVGGSGVSVGVDVGGMDVSVEVGDDNAGGAEARVSVVVGCRWSAVVSAVVSAVGCRLSAVVSAVGCRRLAVVSAAGVVAETTSVRGELGRVKLISPNNKAGGRTNKRATKKAVKAPQIDQRVTLSQPGRRSSAGEICWDWEE